LSFFFENKIDILFFVKIIKEKKEFFSCLFFFFSIFKK